MRRFVQKTALLSSTILITLIMVNYVGDSARLFDSDYELKMAEIVSNNQYVTNISNYDERLFQEHLVKKLSFQPEVVVLGSSRTMKIREEHFEQKLMNNSVSGASVQDLIAIYQLYKEEKKLPKKIMLGLDPWTFNHNNEQERWKSLAAYYYAFKKEENQEEFSLFKIKQLISLSYFQSSIGNIGAVLSGKDQPVATTEKQNYTDTKLTDGSLINNQAIREASPDYVARKVSDYLDGDVYSIEGFDTISKTFWEEFEMLVSDMQANSIEVEFFLAPYHPRVYKVLKVDYPMVMEVEEQLKNFSVDKNIKLHGSFNPNALQMGEDYFYDGMHSIDEGVAKILRVAES